MKKSVTLNEPVNSSFCSRLLKTSLVYAFRWIVASIKEKLRDTLMSVLETKVKTAVWENLYNIIHKLNCTIQDLLFGKLESDELITT